jgi:hypothetical protein
MAFHVSCKIWEVKAVVLVLHGRIAFEGPFAAPERLMRKVESSANLGRRNQHN